MLEPRKYAEVYVNCDTPKLGQAGVELAQWFEYVIYESQCRTYEFNIYFKRACW